MTLINPTLVSDSPDPLTFPTVTTQAEADAFLSVDALLQDRAKRFPDRPFLCEFENVETAAPTYRAYSFAEVFKMVTAIAHAHSRELAPRRREGKQEVVLIVGRSGCRLILNDLAFHWMGHAPLHVSSSAAVPDILKLAETAGATHFVFSPDLENLAHSILETNPLKILPWFDFDTAAILPVPTDIASTRTHLSPQESRLEIAHILHSSGSTGFPKPIPLRHAVLSFDSIDCMPGDKGTITTTPLFHGYARFSIWCCLGRARPLFPFPSTIPPTGDNLYKIIRACPADNLLTVPLLLKEIVDQPKGIELLKRFDTVISCAAPLPKYMGDRLRDEGVRIGNLAAMTETSISLMPAWWWETDGEWEWGRPLPGSANYIDFEPTGDGDFEMIVKNGFPALCLLNRSDGYATNDLYIPHPSRKGLWMIVGRNDDVLVHSTGFKTNAVYIEGLLSSCPLVKNVLVVGNDRQSVAALIIPKSDTSHEAMIDALQPTLAKIDATVPKYSSLIPELIHVLKPTDPFVMSPKNSVMRARSNVKYKAIIDEVFVQFEGGSEATRVLENLEDAESVVHDVIHRCFGKAGEEVDVNLFDAGLDSLTAVRIRNTLHRIVKLPETLPNNVVYDHPTIRRLAHHLWILSQGSTSSSSRIDEMLEILEESKAQIATGEPGMRPTVKKAGVVLVTGATGSFGSHIVRQLADDPAVDNVICLVRANDRQTPKDRVAASLEQRRLSWSSKIECLASDLSDTYLGIGEDRFERLRRDVTHVVHAAWPVNFNHSLSAFKPSIDTTVKFINFCLTSPNRPSLTFTSSIAACMTSPGLNIPEDFILDPSISVFNGYSKSKWIAEALLHHAGSKGLDAFVLRTGQLTGDSTHGIWNQREAPAALIRASQKLGCLPDRYGTGQKMSWLLVDYGAWAVARLTVHGRQEGARLFHLVNPVSTPWTVILEALQMSENLGPLEVVKFDEWVERSKKLEEREPAVVLGDYFNALRMAEWKTFGSNGLVAALEEGGADIRSFCEPFSQDDMTKTISAWRQSGFLLP